MKEIFDKHNITLDTIFKPIDDDIRNKINEELMEPFKKRERDRDKLLKKHPKIIDSNGNETEKLAVFDSGFLNGKIIEDGYDNKGTYSIFAPITREEEKKWNYTLSIQEDIAYLNKLQNDLLRTNKSESEKLNIEKEIINLYLKLTQQQTKSVKENNHNIEWKANQIETIELIKALIENGSIKGKQKDIINFFSETLKIDIKYSDKQIQDIKNRKNGNETKFLDSLKKALNNFILPE